jgi:hypothetical protein
LFLSDPALFALPVRIECREGMNPDIAHVTRARLTEALAGPNGRDIFAARPIQHLITPSPVIADGTTPVALIAKQAAEQGTNALTDGVIVVEQGVYQGLVSPAALFAKAPQVAAVLNWLLDGMARQSRPPDQPAFAVAEVSQARRTPLADVMAERRRLEALLGESSGAHSGAHTAPVSGTLRSGAAPSQAP